jgi:hypothetical protein
MEQIIEHYYRKTGERVDIPCVAKHIESHHSLSIGMFVRHDLIYKGHERMKVVGIRENQVELEGDYSGGIQPSCSKSWFPIKGTFVLRKLCDYHLGGQSCPLHNLHCQYPSCEPLIDTI